MSEEDEDNIFREYVGKRKLTICSCFRVPEENISPEVNVNIDSFKAAFVAYWGTRLGWFKGFDSFENKLHRTRERMLYYWLDAA